MAAGLLARHANARSVATQASGIPTETSLLWFATAVCSTLCAAGFGGALLLVWALTPRHRSRSDDA
ncbi:MAG: hypothetical protein H6724_15540 [Sandaracinus sp.]|nr:hypothetical protein [Myxococcales bacterium]MCB9602011.1 hypothetical protein [Sandaracinus sp.]MCB9620851.1 hypothetical protein [Sandaracinus sp.]